MNFLAPDKLAALEKCFADGRGIRETERLIGVHRDTVSRYFRLLADPGEAARESSGPDAVNFEVVEHDHDWHIFLWHDDTSEWWRHIAVFHNENRARAYAVECQAWDFMRADPAEAPDISLPTDEGPAPERLPAPPKSADTVKSGAAVYKDARAVETPTREQRAAERERRFDEEAAALPPRFCSVCEARLMRRPGEPVLNFSKRKCCSQEHATQAIRRAREAKTAEADGAATSPIDAPADELVAPATAVEPEMAVDLDPAYKTPPGYKECPDCVWSGPSVEYRDHREMNHG